MKTFGPGFVRVLLTFALCSWSLIAFGRAGGGHSYSSGGGSRSTGGGSHSYGGYSGGSSSSSYDHYSSGGYSGSGSHVEIEQWVVVLIIILFFVVVLFVLVSLDKKEKPLKIDSDRLRRRRVRRGLAELRALDQDFSGVAFRDFAHGLFHETHHLRGQNRLSTLAPYLSRSVLTPLMSWVTDLAGVDEIVVASCQITAVSLDPTRRTKIVVSFEASYREHEGARSDRYYARETWTFARERDVRSKPPAVLTARGCPKCGAPRAEDQSTTCRSCGIAETDHRFGWFVTKIESSRQTLPPRLSPYAPNENRRVRAPDAEFAEDIQTYVDANPNFDLDQFLTRAKDIFALVQLGWSENRPARLRPYLTDPLFDGYRYWLDENERQGVRNNLDQIEVRQMIPLSIEVDAYYASLTVRVDASLIDTVVDKDGTVLDGDPRTPRPFTEYWTFIKGTASKLNTISAIDRCPACGAALEVGMTGVCAFCQTRVTTGDFDWILSSIEQE